ncbi:CapA family protein [Nocardioides solisilvae]|uniref:CapA family protein n=1 Tax=Nocardioides solisilvae TaxID=1542435 RepID=UPI000D746129|nr:CapA family protein [Nocardioides solisilvae]
MRAQRVGGVGALLGALLLTACSASGPGPSADPVETSTEPTAGATEAGPQGRLTLAFAGDVHFEEELAALLDDPDATLGPMSEVLAAADLAMVNLESAIATGGRPTRKELEVPEARYWFRSPPSALDLLSRSGVDVVTVANNHGVDFGGTGLRQTLEAADDSPVAVVGVGSDADAAFAPYRTTVGDLGVAVLAADASVAESNDRIWRAGPEHAGIASARQEYPERLLDAVEAAAATDDVVVVYLHWGRPRRGCPTAKQQRLATQLADAGADVVVGTHGHVLPGAGMLDDTYVSYGLADFLWYHGRRPSTGVLTVTLEDGEVVADALPPARIPLPGGQPTPTRGQRRGTALADWEALRGCSGLAPVDSELPAYEAEVSEIDDALARRLRASHDEGRCPVPLADLRHLSLSYVGFDGRARTGELVVHADLADDVVSVFGELYAERWPIRRMRLVDAYGADDDRSMAANNTSAYNCRRVAGQRSWSAHAYGAAIDLNPVQNPYVTSSGILPPRGRRFADVDRSATARPRAGVIRRGDVVTRAFRRVGWTWGGSWRQPDYQHFTAR